MMVKKRFFLIFSVFFILLLSVSGKNLGYEDKYNLALREVREKQYKKSLKITSSLIDELKKLGKNYTIKSFFIYDLYVLRAGIFVKLSRETEALKDYAEARRLAYPYPHLLLYKEAEIYKKMGEIEEARKSLRFALVIEPSFKEAQDFIDSLPEKK